MYSRAVALLRGRFLTLLGFVLHVGNSGPGLFRKDAFYKVKDQILQRWGEPDGTDLQHISKVCFTCDGSGSYYRKGDCRKCYGTGKFEEFWTLLQRYKLGGYSFHKPLSRTGLWAKPPTQKVTIEGYITHQRYDGNKPVEAFYWLTIFFAPRVFWHYFGLSGHGFWRSIRKGLPMCAFGGLLFKLRRSPKDYYNEWRLRVRRRKYEAARRRNPQPPAVDYDDQGIPF
jgi:hypothetical protein